jgi:hypothetical protein
MGACVGFVPRHAKDLSPAFRRLWGTECQSPVAHADAVKVASM